MPREIKKKKDKVKGVTPPVADLNTYDMTKMLPLVKRSPYRSEMMRLCRQAGINEEHCAAAAN